MPRKAPRVSRRQAHLVFFRVIPALIAAAAVVGAAIEGWGLLVGSAVFAGSTLTACPATDAGATYTPITGIQVVASSLTNGYGCGTGPGQVYKYAVLLTYVDDGGVQSSASYAEVYSCYSNGLFSNLVADPSGSLSFQLTIYAFNQASYPSYLDDVAAAENVVTVYQAGAAANWTTTCTATQQAGVSVDAVCQPLAPVGASNDSGVDAAGDAGTDGPTLEAGTISVDTHGFVLPDGGAILCGASPDSGVPGFDSVTASYGQTTTVTCPAPITIAPATPGASYAIALQLDNAGAQIATAQCQATGVAGIAVQATCGAATLGP
jgi:hypothetical protein